MRIGRREFFKRTAVTTAAAVVAPAVVTEAMAQEPKPKLLGKSIVATLKTKPDFSHVAGCLIPQEVVIDAECSDALEWVSKYGALLNLPEGAVIVGSEYNLQVFGTLVVWSHPDFPLRHFGEHVWRFDVHAGYQTLTPVSGEHGEAIYTGTYRRRLYKDVGGNYFWVRDLT